MESKLGNYCALVTTATVGMSYGSVTLELQPSGEWTVLLDGSDPAAHWDGSAFSEGTPAEWPESFLSTELEKASQSLITP